MQRRLWLVVPWFLIACSGQNATRSDDPAPTTRPIESASCASDADCRLFGSGLCECRCMALGASAPDPACSRATDRVAGCAGEPCGGRVARCDTESHRCQVASLVETRAATVPSCESDLECDTCWAGDGCSCRVIAAGTECGPTPGRCGVVACGGNSASCWNHRCVLRASRAAPCASDAECEVRADDCGCDLYAALASAPRSDACSNQDCGARPAPDQWRARCETTASRCVLERRTD